MAEAGSPPQTGRRHSQSRRPGSPPAPPRAAEASSVRPSPVRPTSEDSTKEESEAWRGRRSRDIRRAFWATACVLALLLVPTPSSDGSSGGLALPFDFGALLEALPDGTDKLVHILFFAIETHYLHRGFRHGSTEVGAIRPALGAALVATFGVGLASELLQGAIPTRAADPFDLLADGLGALLWLGGWLLLARP